MEARLWEGDPPEWTTPAWYAGREVAPHLEQEGHRERLELSARMLEPLLDEDWNLSVCDLGAGDGGLLSLLPSMTVNRWGYDLAPVNVAAAAQRGEQVFCRDIVEEWDQVDVGDVAIATELLEHLVDPHALVRAIREKGARYLLASSPYTETAGSHYEYHCWAWDLGGYRAMIEDNGWRVLDVQTAWISQVVLAEVLQ